MIAAIIQARMGSTRLPGKTLMDICGKPLLVHIVERVKVARSIQKIVIATTTLEEDVAILDIANKNSVDGYAGSKDDVLDRYYQSAKANDSEVIVRITADDPFVDPGLIDKIVGFYLDHQENIDYVSNTIKPTYPEGLDLEVFSFKALEKARNEAKKPSEKEHVTPYIWNHPELFHLANILYSEDLSEMRWTIDTEADLKFAREVYSRLYKGQVFYMKDILTLLKNEPELMTINSGYLRHAGYKKSLELDAKHKNSNLEVKS